MTIYVLVDPREKSKIRYVGKTNGKLNERLNSHLCHARNGYNKSYSGYWLKSLIKQKIRPLIFLIEECSDAECARGNRLSAYGYQWSYTKNGFNKGIKYKIFFMKYNNKERVFYSIKEATDYTGLSRSSIDKCLRGEKNVVLGYRFNYLKKGAA